MKRQNLYPQGTEVLGRETQLSFYIKCSVEKLGGKQGASRQCIREQRGTVPGFSCLG